MYGILAWCFNISQDKKIILNAFKVYKNGASISQGKKISIDAFRVYKEGASISQRERKSL